MIETGISLCMITRNEEAYLDKCLGSADEIADEIVVVDTGSTDSTIEIAGRHRAKVVGREWRNDFSDARNAALESATGEWILVMDADEELPTETRSRLPQVVRSTSADGLSMIVRSTMPETDILKFEDTRIVRLFRNRKSVRYVFPIHEQIRPSIESNGGVVADTDLVINHYGYANASVQGNESRKERNLRILMETLSREPGNPYYHYQAGVTLMSMGRKDESRSEFGKALALDYVSMGPGILDRLFMKLSQLELDRNDNSLAMGYAARSLEYNPSNSISMYVMAVGLLSNKRIAEGYQMLLKIKDSPANNLRLDIQLEHLIEACREILKI